MKKINLFSDIITTRGYTRSLFFDSLNGKIHFVDNKVYDVMARSNFKNVSINDIDESFLEYFLENNLIFNTEEELANCFPPISLDWDFPFALSNVVIAVTENTCSNLHRLTDSDFVAHFNFVFEENLSYRSLDSLFDFIDKHICDSIEMTFLINLDSERQLEIERRISKVKKIIVFNNYTELEFSDLIEDKSHKTNRQFVDLDSKNIQLSKNLDHFAESQNHHTYFNRKLFIGGNCEIKNSIECDSIFGYLNELISVEQLKSIINSSDFQKYWRITKSQTDVCKDCELRNLCVDNRIPIKRQTDEWYHEKECSYNPYICKWSDEEEYYSMIECNIHSNAETFSLDQKRILELNRILWQDVFENQ